MQSVRARVTLVAGREADCYWIEGTKACMCKTDLIGC